MVPDNEIVVTKLENKCNFISNFFVLMHFTGQKKKSIGVIHSVVKDHLYLDVRIGVDFEFCKAWFVRPQSLALPPVAVIFNCIKLVKQNIKETCNWPKNNLNWVKNALEISFMFLSLHLIYILQ